MKRAPEYGDACRPGGTCPECNAPDEERDEGGRCPGCGDVVRRKGEWCLACQPNDDAEDE